jgi:FkbM family methyltransferase
MVDQNSKSRQRHPMRDGLIFDIGCHTGEESDFYLKKGFDVVAVEANPSLCLELKRKFSAHIESGRFVLIEKAIAEHNGEVEFFVNHAHSVWSTTRAEWAARNARQGADSTRILVPATTFASLIKEFGVPYYLKIDIEGADRLCLEGLLQLNERPRFLSFESETKSWLSLCGEMSLLRRLGFSGFQIVDQSKVHEQAPPYPPLEGGYADYAFEYGSTGLFGRELPGQWLNYHMTMLKFAQIFAHKRFIGAANRIPPLRPLARRYPVFWHDTHAMRVK